jgi:hypothetical protein
MAHTHQTVNGVRVELTADEIAECEARDIVFASEDAVYDAQAYARNRKAEYDQLNQYEMMFDDKENSTTTWVDKINEIKGRHPK